MTIFQERFEDSGDLDADGNPEYLYSGILYRFDFEGSVFVVRRYDDTPSEAEFLRIEDGHSGKARAFSEIPYQDGNFSKAVVYLKDVEKISVVRVLLAAGYVEIEWRKLNA